ncbi:MAG: cytochrome c oxidase assembly protein [Proteobacteria bacterium]|nr:cytochrome c oxidase assembly protein [Pseudomonadota bacterium]
MAKTNLSQRNRNTMMMLAGVVAGMIGLAYASVPLYALFCKATGFGGTPQRAAENKSLVGTRDMTVSFSTDLGQGMPWHFQPEVRKMEVRTGVTYKALFIAENPTDRTITGSATFNVSPDIFGQYFVKVQCFCFDKQVLKPGERVEMPVVFFLDPKLEEDPYLAKLRDVTLAYTFFQVPNDPDVASGTSSTKSEIQPAAAGQGSGS